MKIDDYLYFPEALCLHLLLTGGVLAFIGLGLQKRGLLHYLSAGFWAAATFGLYFFAVPLLNWLTGEMHYLETRLAVTEGIPRLLWVTFCILAGLLGFFGTYFKTGLRRATFGLRNHRLPPGAWIILTLALLAAAYSLLQFRGSFATSRHQVLIDGGRFTGDVTGYQYVAHLFALFPLAWLIFRENTRKFGFILAAVYLGARFEDSWNRQSVVSLLLCMSMIMTAVTYRRWPRWPGVVAILLISLTLTVRGHLSFRDFLAAKGLIPETAVATLNCGGDASMLATLILETYLADESGYNFGLPTLNRALFGMFPRKYFPEKDEALEHLLSLAPVKSSGDILGSEMLHGAKSTVIGDFYNWGGILMVSLGMAGLGFFCRRLDGMLLPSCPPVVRVLGFLWLGSLWMLLGGHLFWALACLFETALPFLILAGWQKLHLAWQEPAKPRTRLGLRSRRPNRYLARPAP